MAAEQHREGIDAPDGEGRGALQPPGAFKWVPHRRLLKRPRAARIRVVHLMQGSRRIYEKQVDILKPNKGVAQAPLMPS